jgi:hypothetical protein
MGNPIIDNDGTKRWYDLNVDPHRNDGPAVIYTNGTKSWWQHGKLHRGDGPAIEYANGDKWWFLHGNHHRDDGPALTGKTGYVQWWLNNNNLSFDTWLDQVDISAEDKVMMKLKYG